MEKVDGVDPAHARRARRARARRRPPLLRGARRRARRDPRRRLRRGRARRLRPSRRLPRAPGAALGRAVGALEDPRAARRSTSSRAGCAPRCPSRRRRRSCTATTASTTRCSRPTIPGAIVAVLDWEMATLGDPLADLGLFLLYWARDDAQTGSVGATIAPEAGLPDARRGRRALREAVGPRREPARLLRGARVVQARDHPRRHPRAVPDGQDRRRGLRPHRHDGRGRWCTGALDAASHSSIPRSAASRRRPAPRRPARIPLDRFPLTDGVDACCGRSTLAGRRLRSRTRAATPRSRAGRSWPRASPCRRRSEWIERAHDMRCSARAPCASRSSTRHDGTFLGQIGIGQLELGAAASARSSTGSRRRHAAAASRRRAAQHRHAVGVRRAEARAHRDHRRSRQRGVATGRRRPPVRREASALIQRFKDGAWTQ